METASIPQVKTEQGNSTITFPTTGSPRPTPKTNEISIGHKSLITSYGFVFANELAAKEIRKPMPNFAVGSMIVREKRLTLDDKATPEVVIAMVKREKGFSKKTGDWEFFVLEGKNLKLENRQAKGSCADCHIRAKDSDWVFRDYLEQR